jgi:tetratricopeptide (TPR) repeat protein
LLEWLKSRFSRSTSKKSDSESPYDLVVGAYSEFQCRNFGDAEGLLMKALKHRDEVDDPVLNEYILAYLSSIWLLQGQYSEAIRFFSEYIARHPDDAAGYHDRADALWYSGQLKGAIDDYSRTLQLSPTCIPALSSRGQVLVDMDQCDKALVDLDLALDYLRQNPYFTLEWAKAIRAYICNGRAAALARLGSFEEASKQFEKSITLCPDNAWVYFNRARVYDSRAEREKAISDYEFALAKQNPPLCIPKKEQAQNRLRELLGAKGPKLAR